MKIRITKQTTIPMVNVGNIYDVQTVTECRDEKVYFIHHTGNYLGIPDSMCEEVREEDRADG